MRHRAVVAPSHFEALAGEIAPFTGVAAVTVRPKATVTTVRDAVEL